MSGNTVALMQDVGDDFVSSTEMGREIEKGLSDLLTKLEKFETELKSKVDQVGASIDQLDQELVSAAETEKQKNEADSDLVKEDVKVQRSSSSGQPGESASTASAPEGRSEI